MNDIVCIYFPIMVLFLYMCDSSETYEYIDLKLLDLVKKILVQNNLVYVPKDLGLKKMWVKKI